MRGWKIAVSLLLLALVAGVGWFSLSPQSGQSEDLGMALLYNAQDPAARQARETYGSVLEEEGIPHRWLSLRDFLFTDPARVLERHPVLVLPDGAARRLPESVGPRLRAYVQGGGHLVLVFDAGSQDPRGFYRRQNLLEALSPVSAPPGGFAKGLIHFPDPAAARFWGISGGKLLGGRLVSGYSYGPLTYPYAESSLRPGAREWATVWGDEGPAPSAPPVLASRPQGQGRVYWVALPLGHLKAYSDDLPLRGVMRRLAEESALPRLLPSPYGRGGLTINWHVDANPDWTSLPFLESQGVFDPELPQSFHVTAGPDRDRPGDGLGFDACGGRGQALVELMLSRGSVGSHGGWAHNWFSDGLASGAINLGQARKSIERNNACLSGLTGAPVREYSSPNGVHLQPGLTRILEGMGIEAYYYTGDTGSAPNRTFFAGRRVSDRVWAFPVMPYGNLASLGELARAGVSPAELGDWLTDLVDYVGAERTLRLIYAHPYDLDRNRQYLQPWKDFLAELRSRGLWVGTMPEATAFLNRHLKTQYRFRRDGPVLEAELSNLEGLRGVAVQVPEGYLPMSLPLEARFQGRVLWVEANPRNLTLRFTPAEASR